MNNPTYIPSCLKSAAREMRAAFSGQLHELSTDVFVRAWCSVAYLFPGLHPDGYEDAESGWPRVLRPVAAEAWRRADSGELDDAGLYTSDAQWCGLFDRMQIHLPDEIQRRVELAAAFGDVQ